VEGRREKDPGGTEGKMNDESGYRGRGESAGVGTGTATEVAGEKNLKGRTQRAGTKTTQKIRIRQGSKESHFGFLKVAGEKKKKGGDRDQEKKDRETTSNKHYLAINLRKKKLFKTEWGEERDVESKYGDGDFWVERKDRDRRETENTSLRWRGANEEGKTGQSLGLTQREDKEMGSF